MNIGNYTLEQLMEKIQNFHGFAAPGVITGKFMIDIAYNNLPEEGLFDAICETCRCLPDAIQLFTPCTIGNNWLKIFNFGRFALILYNKNNGDGIRVYLNPATLEKWPEIKNWFFKLKPKKEQNYEKLLQQITSAGESIYGIQHVKVNIPSLNKHRTEKFSICPICHEAYPATDGDICLACRGGIPYFINMQ